jgi:hypothetical protein
MVTMDLGEKRNLTVLDDDKVRTEEMVNGDQCYDIHVQSFTKSGSTHAFQSHKSAQSTSEADQSWEFVQNPHIRPQMASQLDRLR